VDHTVTRDQITCYVGNAFTTTWATRAQLLRTAYNNNAPHEVITELLALPEQLYRISMRSLTGCLTFAASA
jgi:hypothetical protein